MSASPKNIGNVYPERLRKEMEEALSFTAPVFEMSGEILESRKEDFAEVEFIFSTWGMFSLSREEIRAFFPALKAVFYSAGTVQAFARPFLSEGVKVFSAWAANAIPVAEMTVSEILLANKGFFQRYHHGPKSTWENRENVGAGKDMYQGNYGANVGLIGAGMVGKAVIRLLKNYRLNVLVYDPFLKDSAAEELGVKKVDDLYSLFESCPVVSNHLANNKETVGMLDYECFRRLMPYSTFINTGRGAQVVEEDLARAMKEDQTRVSLLDVTIDEPPKKDSPLLTCPNIFLTPHIAGSLYHEVERMGEYMFEEYKKLTEGEEVLYEVTMEMLKTMA